MALKITASTFLTKRSLEVRPEGVTYYESSGFGKVRKFAPAQIDLILMSPTNVLSFQVGREVFSIPTKPGNKHHQEVIDALLDDARHFAPPDTGNTGSAAPVIDPY